MLVSGQPGPAVVVATAAGPERTSPVIMEGLAGTSQEQVVELAADEVAMTFDVVLVDVQACCDAEEALELVHGHDRHTVSSSIWLVSQVSRGGFRCPRDARGRIGLVRVERFPLQQCL